MSRFPAAAAGGAPLSSGCQAFRAGLDACRRAALGAVLAGARHDPGALPRWGVDGHAVGLLARDHAALLAQLWPELRHVGADLHWDTPGWSAARRSERLAEVAARLRAAGRLPGWRDELYATWAEREADADPARPELFRLERGAYRFFGLRSHAVHINGYTPDGRMWCGRRALSKATDPGKLDNLAAGGLPAGEAIMDCLVRELREEAAVPAALARQARRVGRVVTSRLEPQGWHDETLVVCNLALPADFTPRNTDGEVGEFLCLSPAAVLERIATGEFSPDAACVIAVAATLAESPGS